MQKGREPLRSHIIIQPWELSVLLEEIRMNSDDSYEAVMRLATRVMQAYEVKVFLINNLEILEIAIWSKARERETLTRFSKLAEGRLFSQDPKIHTSWNTGSLYSPLTPKTFSLLPITYRWNFDSSYIALGKFLLISSQQEL